MEQDVVKSSEWHILQSIRDFLVPFYEVTLATEGRKDTLEKILPSMEFLLDHYEQAFITFQSDNFQIIALDAGYNKLINTLIRTREILPTSPP